MKPDGARLADSLVALEAIPAAAGYVHPDGGVVEMNRAAAGVFGDLEAAQSADLLSLAAETRAAAERLGPGNPVGRNDAPIIRTLGLPAGTFVASAKWIPEADAALVVLLPASDDDRLLHETFLRQAPVGIVHIDVDGFVTFENEQFVSVIRCRTGAGWKSRRADEIRELAQEGRAAIRRLVADGTGFCLPRVPCTCPDGIRRVLLLAGSSIVHPNGNRVGSVLMVIDQTESARHERTAVLRSRFRSAEAALRNAASSARDEQEFLESAAHTIADAMQVEETGIVVAGPHDGVFRIRAQWPRQSGDECRPVSDLLQSDRPDTFWTPFVLDGEVQGFVAFRDTRDLHDEDRTQLLALTDELVRVFERQWESVQAGYRYRLAVESIEDGLFNFVLQPDGSRRYLFATPQFERLFGLSPAAVVAGDAGSTWFESGLDDGGRAALDNHHAALAAGIPSRTVFRFSRPDGEIRWLREDATPQRETSGRLSVTGIVVDVSEQKEAEQMLVKARLAAEAEARRKTAFIATMSHELRTPLGTIHGFAELLRRELESLPPDNPLASLGEFSSAIEERSGELLAVVDDLLDLSNLESGLISLPRVVVPLNDLCSRLVEKYRRMATGSEVTINLEARAEAAASGDPTRIEKILDRVLSNAVKFTRRGTVTVSTAVTGDGACVTVADEGVGMTAEQLARIFEPFVQGDDRLNRSYEGVGVGLTVARKLAMAMGGTLDATSSPGSGTTVRLVLPAA